ncbi:MAG TPA: non-canonical purine NTP pyrophosphatase [Opitutaceae bacterium]|nr:non-canonical purine NTP pyrophosphatase [Opitutaceae bacterium]
MKLYLASANADKAAELRALADEAREAGPADPTGPRVEIGHAADVGGMPPVVEDAGTFAGNALKKARALRSRLPEDAWVLADDSGLCVDALGGAPGVESAYFAGSRSDPAANLAKLVSEMRGVPDDRRAAEFVCVLALLGPGAGERLFEGRCPGRLIREPRGRGGFGYDPIFVPEGFEMTLAEMAPALKNRVGHRGRAWAGCAAWLAARA